MQIPEAVSFDQDEDFPSEEQNEEEIPQEGDDEETDY